jgi:hypothetical protein
MSGENMSDENRFCESRRSWIASSLLGVAICVPIASLLVFSQSRTASSALVATPNSATVEISKITIGPVRRNRVSCNPVHPVSCVYAHRAWVAHLEQELDAVNFSLESPQEESLQDWEDRKPETANSISSIERPATPADLGRKTRWLTQLKVWLDAIP